MSQREEAVRKQWQEIEIRLSQEKHEVFSRLMPLFTAVKNHRLLRQLFPYTSHERLCFGFPPTFPSQNPCFEPIPNMSEFVALAASREVEDFEISSSLLQSFLDKYHFLLEKEQSPIILDEHKKIRTLSDVSLVIDWILEQTYEMYTVYGNTSLDPEKNPILRIADTQEVVDLLVNWLKAGESGGEYELESEEMPRVQSENPQANFSGGMKQRQNRSKTTYSPEPGELIFDQLEELSEKDQIIIYRLVELGVTVRNTHKDEITIAVEVPHNLADPINIEIGFLLNELASGDFAENLWEMRSSRNFSVDLSKIREKKSQWGIRFAESYPAYLKYYVYKR